MTAKLLKIQQTETIYDRFRSSQITQNRFENSYTRPDTYQLRASNGQY